MDDITILETREVLKRLVRERKALEHGLDAANKLADIEAVIADRQALLDRLVLQCGEKNAELISLDENVSAIHQRREAACVAREKEADAKVRLQEAVLDDMQKQYAERKATLEKMIDGLVGAHSAAVEEHQEEIATLALQVAELRKEYNTLQEAARKMAGV